ncbi:MAG: hypothetical protein AB7S69_12545 [Salinivirgaceae bacterium]|jgi:hypothetical protein
MDAFNDYKNGVAHLVAIIEKEDRNLRILDRNKYPQHFNYKKKLVEDLKEVYHNIYQIHDFYLFKNIQDNIIFHSQNGAHGLTIFLPFKSNPNLGNFAILDFTKNLPQ